MKSLREALVHKHMDDLRTIFKDGDIAVQHNGVCLVYMDGKLWHYISDNVKTSDPIQSWDKDLRLIEADYKGWRDIDRIFRAELLRSCAQSTLFQIINHMKPIWKRK